MHQSSPTRRQPLRLSRRFVLFSAALVPAGLMARPASATPNQHDGIFNSFKSDLFGDRPLLEDTGLITLEAPKRAQDAAIVPIDIAFDRSKAPEGVKALTIVVDVNPAPVAAEIVFGPDAGVHRISTRLRVDDYSFIRAIAETQDGKLHMVKSFVKASGGCSAPALKNQDEAMASLGQMKLRQFPPADAAATPASGEMQVQIRHPNNSGFQRDPLTHHFIPAHFVSSIEVAVDQRPIMKMDGGISLSEDPSFRFDYALAGGREIMVKAEDTQGTAFESSWPVETAAL
jgi:sulfur-oxidizing protein SoxY